MARVAGTGAVPSDFPPPRAELVPATSRLAELENGIKASSQLLPSACEMLRRFRPDRPKIRPADPPTRETLLQCYARDGREPLERIFERAAGQHRKLLQEIERAREVFSFAREELSAPGQYAGGAGDAIRNALLSLQFQRDQQTDRQPADAETSAPGSGVFQENRLLLGRHRLGILAHLAQHGLRRGTLMFSVSCLGSTRDRFAPGSPAAAERQMTGLLVYIGWRAAPTRWKAGR